MQSRSSSTSPRIRNFATSHRLPHYAQCSAQNLLEAPETLFVIVAAPADDLMGVFAAVNMGYFTTGRHGIRSLFVSKKIVPYPVQHGRRHLCDVGPFPISRVVLEHSQDLVVGLIVVDHAQAADGNALH